jgi:hypothetical protein
MMTLTESPFEFRASARRSGESFAGAADAPARRAPAPAAQTESATATQAT